jgi:hypothetical protein
VYIKFSPSSSMCISSVHPPRHGVYQVFTLLVKVYIKFSPSSSRCISSFHLPRQCVYQVFTLLVIHLDEEDENLIYTLTKRVKTRVILWRGRWKLVPHLTRKMEYQVFTLLVMVYIKFSPSSSRCISSFHLPCQCVYQVYENKIWDAIKRCYNVLFV